MIEVPFLVSRPSIQPAFSMPHGGYTQPLCYVESVLAEMIPADVLLSSLVPLVTWTEPLNAPCTIAVQLLCPAQFTHGVGRYMTDTFSRWLLPGKFVPVCSVHSLAFEFTQHLGNSFFFHQVLLEITDAADICLVRETLPKLAVEMRLNILAVKHARSIVATKQLTSEEQQAMIQENLTSVLNRPAKEFDHNVFDQMHHLWMKISSEEKIAQFKEKFSPLVSMRPKVFDSDIFNEIQNFVLLFRDRFSAERDLAHLTRLIGCQYLFRKFILRRIEKHPNERHLSIKVLRSELTTKEGKKSVLGVVVGMNLLKDTELFEERHLVSAIQHSLPGLIRVKGSYVLDRRAKEKILLTYVEVQKEGGLSFTSEEMQHIRKKLPREVKEGIENVTHTLIMPRNEEEVMRSILLLSKQLRYTRDIPQATISFETLVDDELCFQVILLRLCPIKVGCSPIQDKMRSKPSSLTFQDFEIKEVGILRKNYIKEASIFRVKINKKPFLRKNRSLDLFKARSAVAQELAHIVGEFRDYNGGFLSKQQEGIEELKSLLPPTHNEFLLENFFHSLSPPLMQSILPAPILKTLFCLLEKTLETEQNNTLCTETIDNYLLILLCSKSSQHIGKALSAALKMQNASTCFAHCIVEGEHTKALGMIFRSDSSEEQDKLLTAIQTVG